jgi:large subunit ribosomal protein L19e
MDLKTQKRMAAEIMKCGGTRVRMTASKEVEDALTRQDIRDLIKKGLITKVQKKGTSRAKAKKILTQKKRGRRSSTGKRKGKWGARNPSKALWIRKVRPLRERLRMLRDTGQLEVSDFRKTLLRVKGGYYRNMKHMMLQLKEKELLKKPEAGTKAKAVKKARKPVKKTVKKAAPKKPAAKKPAAKKVKK